MNTNTASLTITTDGSHKKRCTILAGNDWVWMDTLGENGQVLWTSERPLTDLEQRLMQMILQARQIIEPLSRVVIFETTPMDLTLAIDTKVEIIVKAKRWIEE